MSVDRKLSREEKAANNFLNLADHVEDVVRSLNESVIGYAAYQKLSSRPIEYHTFVNAAGPLILALRAMAVVVCPAAADATPDRRQAAQARQEPQPGDADPLAGDDGARLLADMLDEAGQPVPLPDILKWPLDTRLAVAARVTSPFPVVANLRPTQPPPNPFPGG